MVMHGGEKNCLLLFVVTEDLLLTLPALACLLSSHPSPSYSKFVLISSWRALFTQACLLKRHCTSKALFPIPSPPHPSPSKIFEQLFGGPSKIIFSCKFQWRGYFFWKALQEVTRCSQMLALRGSSVPNKESSLTVLCAHAYTYTQTHREVFKYVNVFNCKSYQNISELECIRIQ